MADLLDDFKTYFLDAGLVVDGAFFKDAFGDTPDAAVAVYEYSGFASPPQIEGALRSIQIVVRDALPTVAKRRANELYQSLSTDNGIVYLTELRWGQLQLRQPPFKMRVDTRDRVYYGFNLGINTYLD